MTEIALVSDIHFGCRSNSEKYLNIAESFFIDTLLPLLQERKITDLRILGDLFDNRNSINVRTLNIVLGIFRKYYVKYPELRISCILGNHDIYYHNKTNINSIEALRELPNVDVIDYVTVDVINGKKILMVPWITTKESQITKDFYQYVKNETDIIMGHFEIRGFEMSPGITDDRGFEHSIFKKTKRVISGHYHLRNTDGKITYIGCPFQLTWSDYGNDKGIHILNVENNELEFIKNNDSPVHIKISVSDLVAGKGCKVKNNFVRLVIDKKYKDSSVVKIINKLESAGPLKLDVDNQYVDALSFDENAEADLSELNDPLAFLVEYAKIIELENDYTQPELIKRLSEMYQLTVREND